MKTASALLKNGKIYIQAYAETTAGVWIAFGPVHVCRVDELEKLRSSILEALAHSTRGVLHPSQQGWKDVQRPMLEAVDAKNWASLAKGARAVSLECEDEIVRLIPSLDYHRDGGASLEDKAISLPLEDKGVSASLIRAFELST